MYQEFKRPVNMNKILSRQRNAAKYASADITRTKYERYSLFASQTAPFERLLVIGSLH